MSKNVGKARERVAPCGCPQCRKGIPNGYTVVKDTMPGIGRRYVAYKVSAPLGGLTQRQRLGSAPSWQGAAAIARDHAKKAAS